MTRAEFLKTVEKFLREQDMAPATFGRAAVRDPLFVFGLREGREPREATTARVLAFIEQRQQAAA